MLFSSRLILGGQAAPWSVSNSITSHSEEVICPLYSALVQLYLEHCALFCAQNLTRMWGSLCLGEVNKCDEKGWKAWPERSSWGLWACLLGEKEPGKQPHGSSCQLPRGKAEREVLISLEGSERMCGNVSELPQAKFRLDIRTCSFTKRVVKCWDRLPRVVVTLQGWQCLDCTLTICFSSWPVQNWSDWD